MKIKLDLNHTFPNRTSLLSLALNNRPLILGHVVLKPA